MWQTKLTQQFSFSPNQNSDEAIAKEAKNFLVGNIDEQIRDEVEIITQRWTGSVNNQTTFYKTQQHIINYFNTLKEQQNIYEFVVEDNKCENTITIHYRKDNSLKTYVLTVKII